ncbi:hypothetical protein ALT721_2340030 [Alteromonas alvinellae]
MMVKLAVCLRRPATSLFPAVPEIEDRLSDNGREARSYFFPFWAQRGFLSTWAWEVRLVCLTAPIEV